MGNMLWETLKDEHPNPYKTSPLLYSLSPQFQFINSRLLSPLNWIWLVRAHYNSFWPGPCFTRLQQCAYFSVTSKQPYKCRAAEMLIKPYHLTIHRRHCVVNTTASVARLQKFNSKTVYFCLVCALGHQWRHKLEELKLCFDIRSKSFPSDPLFFFSNCVLAGRQGQFQMWKIDEQDFCSNIICLRHLYHISSFYH